MESSALTGKWSLDYYRSNSTSHFFFYFASKGVTHQVTDGKSGAWPLASYCLFLIDPDDPPDTEERTHVVFGYRSRDGQACQGVSEYVYDIDIGWHHFEMTRDNRGYLQLYYDGSLLGETQYSDLDTSEYLSIQLAFGDRIDNLKFEEDRSTNVGIFGFLETNQDVLLFTTGGIIALFLIIKFGRSYYYKRKSRNLKKLFMSRSLNYSAARNSKNANFSQLSLFAGTVDNGEDGTIKIENYLPPEILEFKFLMHPARLSIMKLLVIEGNLRSANLRDEFDMSWGEYSNHINSLEERGYIITKDEFDSSTNLVKRIYITDFGIQEFTTLFKLLEEFIEIESPVINNYIKLVSNQENLYPTK